MGCKCYGSGRCTWCQAHLMAPPKVTPEAEQYFLLAQFKAINFVMDALSQQPRVTLSPDYTKPRWEPTEADRHFLKCIGVQACPNPHVPQAQVIITNYPDVPDDRPSVLAGMPTIRVVARDGQWHIINDEGVELT